MTDWKQLYQNIHDFAGALGTQVQEEETGFVGGKITEYRIETNGLYYQIKHSKPRADRGSKVRIFSESDQHVKIVFQPSLFRKSKLLKTAGLSPEVINLLDLLTEKLRDFSWSFLGGDYEWPAALNGKTKLIFKSKDLFAAVEHLELITEIQEKLSIKQ